MRWLYLLSLCTTALLESTYGKRVIRQAHESSCFHFAMRFAPAECEHCLEADWDTVSLPMTKSSIGLSKSKLSNFWERIIPASRRVGVLPFESGKEDSILTMTNNFELEYSITAHVDMPHLKIAIYTDEDRSWEKLYYSDRACPQKYVGARCTLDLSELPERQKTYQFNNNATDATYDEWKKRVNYKGNFRCPMNERRNWVYVALLNFDLQGCYDDRNSWRCTDVGPVMNVSYDFSALNEDSSFQEFSDEEGRMLGFVISMLSVSLLCLVGPLIFDWWVLSDMDHMHATVWLLFASVGFYLLGLICLLVHLTEYEMNGIGNDIARIAGHVFLSFADITMFELILLIGYGWTIVSSRLAANTAVLHAIFITFYALTDLTSLAWYETERGGKLSQAKVVFFWESGPGYLLLALRILGAFVYLIVMTSTVRKKMRKVKFYWKFTMLALFYTVCPSMIVAISFNLAEQEREQTAFFGDVIILFFTYLIFLVMYNPWLKCVLGFPYHTRKSLMVLNEWERAAGALPAKLPEDATELQILAHIMKLIRSLSSSVEFLDAKSQDLTQLIEGFVDPTSDQDLPGLKPKATMQSFGSKDTNIRDAIRSKQLSALNADSAATKDEGLALGSEHDSRGLE